MNQIHYVALCDNLLLDAHPKKILDGLKPIGTFESNPLLQLYVSKNDKGQMYLTKGTNSYEFKLFKVNTTTFNRLCFHYNTNRVESFRPVCKQSELITPFCRKAVVFITDSLENDELFTPVICSHIEDYLLINKLPF